VFFGVIYEMGVFVPNSKLHPLCTQVLHELQLSTSEVLLEFGEVKVCVHINKQITSGGFEHKSGSLPPRIEGGGFGGGGRGLGLLGWTLARVFSLT
jgi:hypothetical protein